MNLPRFQLLGPSTLKEALSLMTTYGEKVRVLAGGTEITGRLKHRLLSPPCILSLKKVKGLGGIKQKKNDLVVGAATTLTDLAESRIVAHLSKSVSDAARHVAAPAIRNMATLGGNLLQENRCLYYNQSELPRKRLGPCYKLGGATCHAARGLNRCFSVYQGDTASALIAVGAKVRLQNSRAVRTLPVEELFTGKGTNPLSIGRGELLTEIIIPVSPQRTASAYRRFAMRGSIDYPLASAAAFLTVGKDDTIDRARIVMGACGSGPRIAQEAANMIKGKRPEDVSDVDVQQAASLAVKGMEAVDNLILPASYRRELAAVMTARALGEALASLREVDHARRA